MSDLHDLYQEVLLDHAKAPRNRGSVEAETHRAEGHNPLCGDCVTVSLRIEDGLIRAIRFEGVGCAISTASASMMTELLEGKSVEEAERLFEGFRSSLVENAELEPECEALRAMEGVKAYPMRVKCATLPWHALHAALHGGQKAVTTE